ncbi:heavy metal translocating P-type ATPase [Sulfurospirillum multivorans]|uniref:P-type Zn(2+) transporter n=2 Tax=Sulfurospirillum multivorans TaxID=66821 RepID=A0AA86AQK7_SULMK|nr:heavy metal translocating P-type ATPase [Sulfurospirillum multivorans]AHJ13987.1 cation-transporting ATPase [Sulfurospirillum multivorans DSM 12446]QEH07475.1 cation-transporting ATPase [Sulfurospirillum multivorans]
MHKTRLIHQTSQRLRYVTPALKQINTHSLTTDLKVIAGVREVRINSKIGSVVFEGENLNAEALLAHLQTIDISKYQICDASINACFNDHDEGPSLKGIVRSSMALAFQPFIPQPKIKLAVSTLASLPLLKEGMIELFSEGLTSKVLEAMAVGVSLARRDYAAANSTNLMLEIGEYIEETTVHKSDDLIKELAKPNVDEAWVEVEENGKCTEKRISTSEVKVGDIVIVGAGDTIPIDGHIIDGTASINQVSMTGEAEPVKKERGGRVISGTIVEAGRIRIWAEQVGDDTATQRIRHYIKSSLDEKSAIGLKATHLADKLVPITLGMAGLSYLIRRDMASVAAVLQADYSCALKLATPVAFKNSLSIAGHHGILIKGAKALEALSHVDTFIFDKTGTLTHGELEVVEIYSFDKAWSKDAILNLTASAEEHYFHPVAEAVVKAAKERGFVHMHHEEVEFIVAHGVRTQINGKEAIIGSRHFLEEDEQVSFSEHEAKIEKCLENGKILLYIAYDNKLLGTIGMVDRVRANAKEALLKLRKLGAKEIVMLTGDVEDKAQALAKELGIDTVYARLLPTDKSNIVQALKESGKHVAFIGDGINDAPALMNANVGISMYKGADIAKATADISLLKDDIDAVVEAKILANKTMARIQSNFNATVGINSFILMGAAVGLLSPVKTAFLHNGTTIGLLLNSMQKIRIEKS